MSEKRKPVKIEWCWEHNSLIVGQFAGQHPYCRVGFDLGCKCLVMEICGEVVNSVEGSSLDLGLVRIAEFDSE